MGNRLSPLEKAIADFKSKSVFGNGDYYSGFDSGLNSAIDYLESLLPYEKQYLRDVAEKAWDAHVEGELTQHGYKFKYDKQTYLNQNHPL